MRAPPSNKHFILVLIALLILAGVGYSLFQISKMRTFQFFGGLTARVETSQKVVALTMDDAPSPTSHEVVQLLADKGVKTTFYMIGNNIQQYPHEAQEIATAGNEIGNHSYSHMRFYLVPLTTIDTEIQTTNTLIRGTGYQGPITFRPPNGKKLFLLPWYLHEHHMETIMWDVEPDTYAAHIAAALTQYTLDHVRPGSIILLHPFCGTACAADRAALPAIIDALRAKGYKLVTVSELLKYKNVGK